ncbi:MAG: T9SS type A sorting domain-containing protein, partial [Paraprevotella sp.]|nr:T9SS type A sorting domain-containing protein [Paraprevotella sp.]
CFISASNFLSLAWLTSIHLPFINDKPSVCPSRSRWTHIAVTLDGNNAAMYVNGELVDEADNFTLSLDDIKPILNYIGRSQFDDPLLRANIDEFRIYNYAMDKSQVNRLAQGITDEITSVLTDKDVAIWPSPATDVLNISIAKEFVDAGATIYLYNIKGYVVMQQTANLNNLLNISSLPSGIYNITIDSAKGKIVKKIIVK